MRPRLYILQTEAPRLLQKFADCVKPEDQRSKDPLSSVRDKKIE